MEQEAPVIERRQRPVCHHEVARCHEEVQIDLREFLEKLPYCNTDLEQPEMD